MIIKQTNILALMVRDVLSPAIKANLMHVEYDAQKEQLAEEVIALEAAVSIRVVPSFTSISFTF